MTTKIIDLTQSGGSAGEFEKGTVGWFYDDEGGALSYGIYGGRQGGECIYVYFNGNEKRLWTHFSPTLPDWAKVEPKKPIELVKLILFVAFTTAYSRPSDFIEITLLDRNTIDGFDLIKGLHKDGDKLLFLGHWNDRVV